MRIRMTIGLARRIRQVAEPQGQMYSNEKDEQKRRRSEGVGKKEKERKGKPKEMVGVGRDGIF